MNRKASILLLAVCVMGFALGIAELFRLRFETGDVYPAYSTLRSDPLGASAFYEGLERMPGATVSRDLSADNELPEGPGTAYLHLAGNPDEWTDMTEDEFKVVDDFVKSGGRLVVALYPQEAGWHYHGFGVGTNALPGRTNGVPIRSPLFKPKSGRAADKIYRTISLTELWGFGFDLRDLTKNADDSYAPVEARNAHDRDLPASLDWHSGVIFTNLDPAWRVIYARGKDAVLIERSLGRGSVVFSSDSFFVSNEAMVRDRHAALLAWLVGPNQRVVFDEAHLGIVEQPGVAMLLRKYQLGGFMAALALLAGLFIWKNASPLAPTAAGAQAEDFVIGKDSAAGFVNLLRRHVAYRDILAICLTEWRKSGIGGKYSPARLARAQAVIDEENARPDGERDPLRTYAEIGRALNERGVPVVNATPTAAPKTTA